MLRDRFTKVWGLSATHVLAAGAKGIVRVFEGGEAWALVEPKSPKKTPLIDDWPADRKVPPAGTLDYVGIFGLDAEHLWLFDKAGVLVRYDNEYEL